MWNPAKPVNTNEDADWTAIQANKENSANSEHKHREKVTFFGE